MRVKIQAITDHENKPKHSCIVGEEREMIIGRHLTLSSESAGNRAHTSDIQEISSIGPCLWVKTMNTIYVLRVIGAK
jgi:hypothetical protein